RQVPQSQECPRSGPMKLRKAKALLLTFGIHDRRAQSPDGVARPGADSDFAFRTGDVRLQALLPVSGREDCHPAVRLRQITDRGLLMACLLVSAASAQESLDRAQRIPRRNGVRQHFLVEPKSDLGIALLESGLGGVEKRVVDVDRAPKVPRQLEGSVAVIPGEDCFTLKAQILCDHEIHRGDMFRLAGALETG